MGDFGISAVENCGDDIGGNGNDNGDGPTYEELVEAIFRLLRQLMDVYCILRKKPKTRTVEKEAAEEIKKILANLRWVSGEEETSQKT